MAPRRPNANPVNGARCEGTECLKQSQKRRDCFGPFSCSQSRSNAMRFVCYNGWGCHCDHVHHVQGKLRVAIQHGASLRGAAEAFCTLVSQDGEIAEPSLRPELVGRSKGSKPSASQWPGRGKLSKQYRMRRWRVRGHERRLPLAVILSDAKYLGDTSLSLV